MADSLSALALIANPCDNITEKIQSAFIVGIDNDQQRIGGPIKTIKIEISR